MCARDARMCALDARMCALDARMCALDARMCNVLVKGQPKCHKPTLFIFHSQFCFPSEVEIEFLTPFSANFIFFIVKIKSAANGFVR